MPRGIRVQFAGGFFHVITRGNRRQLIFTDDIDRRFFLELIGRVVAKHGWRCHSYCLMPNHYHLLVETPAQSLSDGMQTINGVYAQWFNLRHGYEGHLFERRFRSFVVEGDAHVRVVARYIVLNPVRAGLCRSAADWPWSSYAAALGKTKRPRFLTLDFLLGQFGPNTDRARTRFAEFVLDAPPRAGP
jgi:REP element-mobilizing transposase RayT